jgi:hypothetical protein
MKHEWKVDYFKLDANSWVRLISVCGFVKMLQALKPTESGWKRCGKCAEKIPFCWVATRRFGRHSVSSTACAFTDDINRHADTVKSLSMQCFQRNWCTAGCGLTTRTVGSGGHKNRRVGRLFCKSKTNT